MAWALKDSAPGGALQWEINGGVQNEATSCLTMSLSLGKNQPLSRTYGSPGRLGHLKWNFLDIVVDSHCSLAPGAANPYRQIVSYGCPTDIGIPYGGRTPYAPTTDVFTSSTHAKSLTDAPFSLRTHLNLRTHPQPYGI